MKKSNFKRFICLVALTALILSSFSIEVSANSAQWHWSGVDSTGAMVFDKDCPIEVEKEVLTFDISQFPSNHYASQEDFLAYDGKVSAEYTFYNPSDLTITATLAFPFGNQPDYANTYNEQTGEYETATDAEKYDITVNGEPVNKKIRYTLKTDSQFNLEGDLKNLQNEYITHSFYTPSTTVTKYTYVVGGENKEGLIGSQVGDYYTAPTAGFDWDGGNGQTRIYFPDWNSYHLQDNGVGRFGTFVRNGDYLTLYAFGEPLTAPITWQCYQNGGMKNGEEIYGLVSLVSTQTTTFESFVFEKYSEKFGISTVDWYNAVLCSFKDYNGGKNNLNVVENYSDFSSPYVERFLSNLLRWYEYEITILPKQTIVNCVTAPIYPSIDLSYKPSVCKYVYLLSPASTWASFKEIEIIINTPYYITESSIKGFNKTENGYTYKQSGLPTCELEFTLCTDQNPTPPNIDGCRFFNLFWW